MDLCELMIPTEENDDKNNQALIASVQGEIFAIPLSSVLSIEKVTTSGISTVGHEEVIDLRGSVIPLVHLDKLFALQTLGEEKDQIIVVVCTYKDATFGLIVDELFGQKSIESKSLGVLEDNSFFTGASIIDEDDVALILNVPSFIA